MFEDSIFLSDSLSTTLSQKNIYHSQGWVPLPTRDTLVGVNFENVDMNVIIYLITSTIIIVGAPFESVNNKLVLYFVLHASHKQRNK